MLQEYDHHILLTKLQFLINLFEEKTHQHVLFDQQESFISLLKYEIHYEKIDCTQHLIREFKT